MVKTDPKLIAKIPELYLQTKSLPKVAALLGIGEETVRRHAHNLGIAVSDRGGHRRGSSHPEWRSGRIMDRDGYILISCDKSHPGCRQIAEKRRTGKILEHRIFAEIALGRYLLPGEVVDHIDGCRFHNDPKNLRVFSSNAEHLKMTLSGKVPQWTKKGKEKILLSRWNPSQIKPSSRAPLDTYSQRKKSYDAQKQQIHLGRELLGNHSIWFLGMRTQFLKSEIDWPFDEKTERDLCQKYLQMLLVHPALKLWIQG